MGLDKSAYSGILDNIGSIVPCPFGEEQYFSD